VADEWHEAAASDVVPFTREHSLDKYGDFCCAAIPRAYGKIPNSNATTERLELKVESIGQYRVKSFLGAAMPRTSDPMARRGKVDRFLIYSYVLEPSKKRQAPSLEDQVLLDKAAVFGQSQNCNQWPISLYQNAACVLRGLLSGPLAFDYRGASEDTTSKIEIYRRQSRVGKKASVVVKLWHDTSGLWAPSTIERPTTRPMNTCRLAESTSKCLHEAGKL